jgi:hypothetical protein
MLLSDAPAKQTAMAELRFDPQDMLMKPRASDGTNPLDGHAYLILEFLADEERRDWAQFAPLKAAWEALREAYEDEDGKTTSEEMERLFARYERLCRASPDLLPGDAIRKIAKAREKFAPLAGLVTTRGFTGHRRRSLPDFAEIA